ncbi:TIGR03745 family integrating conjugative element membrane protein [Ectothiorhodospira variabilis]|uniref:TIGR03745 family integrating conjugative element membrane protein n=1 Tax=Ectothiorhodospira variabilis TaxID=505694 RepID=UPI001EFBA865|nr:TIGR03745 family integrating conjugative element membrane protein [Ectothiorhodospira variabilis]MCG5495560.1 TIGR03745 family integrating conjugative element membrane protein [Ectothiorhodospira variabilis]MCG5505168.1 TIGR03745 family integrating conjugative element membrane protein [Ectothiorhodospira variabilis]MCG5508325.1 TIGR03745 family integrating conjugative element membrane protein [Ectothiorhodospira variabilis]
MPLTKRVKSLSYRAHRGLATVTVAGIAMMSQAAHALTGNLPSPVDPSSGAVDDGDWISLIRGYIADGAIVLGLALGTIGLLWIAYTAIAKFNECRTGKAEWSELGVLGIVGAVVLLFVMFLIGQAAGVF